MKLYVGNLPYSIGDSELGNLFAELGEVVSASVVTSEDGKRSKGFGFVEMSCIDAGKQAIEKFNEFQFEGRALKVAEAKQPKERDNSSNTLYVGNLPFSYSDDQLRDFFKQFGDIVSARIITDRQTGRSKGFGFIEVADSGMADVLIDNANGAQIDGRQVKVTKAKPKR